MSDVEQIVKDLAVIAALKQLLAKVELDRKAEFQAAIPRGSVKAFDGVDMSDEHMLGRVDSPKPSQPKPQIVVEDEAQMLAWMVDEFGDDIIETRVQLTEQGRKSLELRAVKETIPGVAVTIPEPRPVTPKFVPSKNVVALVQGMVQRGELSVTHLLEIGGGGQ